MYRAYYGLTFDPFTKEVNTKNFFKSYQFNQGLSKDLAIIVLAGQANFTLSYNRI